ncbi:DNA cytosine methyltransferase [Ferribacterium limneticum]|uniref:DNA cytosine methyltransferase n=1 Tax=Ferribacterium limneticum TaxID=76259 RepID=UPI001CF80472|nr:DNA cytosine methyltransferase [Ferribacterium limneticum]UCV21483.1 DNA cytosine methyltransferase [Ferribacterium limneticum]
MSKLRAVSLFSNCGAGDVGYRNAGFYFEVMAELDPRRLDVCLLNHPGAEGVAGDLRKTWTTVIKRYRVRAGRARPALLCACPPCQGMSSARSGLGSHDDAAAGSKDERNLLATVVANVALELKPSLIVVENVPAFFTRKVHHPEDKKPVSAANYLITALADEYVAFPLIADLCDFGVPQSRNRAFLTFVRKDLPGLKESLRIGRAPFPRATHAPDVGNSRPITLSEALESFALPALDAATPETASASEYAGFHSVPVWDERIYAMVAAIPKATGRSAWDNDVCHHCGPVKVLPETVTCPLCRSPLLRPIVKEEDGSYRLVKGFKSSYRRMHSNKPAATVTTASGHIGSDYTIHPTQNRLLSPLECSLLQTFPKDFKWGDALKKLGHTNVREMIGEAVPPAFTKLHGEVLHGILKRKWERAPIALSDERCLKGWAKLVAAAKKDDRDDPRSYFDHGKLPPSGRPAVNKQAEHSAPVKPGM